MKDDRYFSTAGTLAIERPQCTLRRKANVLLTDAVRCKVANLERQRKTSEASGDFENCQKISKQIARTKADEEKRRYMLTVEYHSKQRLEAEGVGRKLEEGMRKRYEAERAKTLENFAKDMEKLRSARLWNRLKTSAKK